jgi:hypothetical protein
MIEFKGSHFERGRNPLGRPLVCGVPHLKTDFDGLPIAFHLTGGEVHDTASALVLTCYNRFQDRDGMAVSPTWVGGAHSKAVRPPLAIRCH